MLAYIQHALVCQSFIPPETGPQVACNMLAYTAYALICQSFIPPETGPQVACNMRQGYLLHSKLS